jgi:F1F0 ATPase subunit 2
MQIDPVFLAGNLVAGFFAGLLNYWALWETVRRMVGASRPRTLLLASFVLRHLGLAAVLFVASGFGNPLGLMAGVVGLLLARTAATAIVKRPAPERVSQRLGEDD